MAFHPKNLALVAALSQMASAEPMDYLTYNNNPQGTASRPLVLRTFLPNLDLDSEVTARHTTGHPSPVYSPKSGELNPKRNYQPISGIPAAISVSAGPALSYAWDTTECRLLYAWSDGFLDMESYWGTPGNGMRKKNDYVPRLIGNLFYKAQTSHPLRINGQPLAKTLRYTGHTRKNGHPAFSFQSGESVITLSISAGEKAQSLKLIYSSSVETDILTYEDSRSIPESSEKKLIVTLLPNTAETFTGFKEELIEIKKANSKTGEELYETYGCIACHSLDGGGGHGPTFLGLAGSVREFPGSGKVVANTAYLRESITAPEAKSVPNFPKGMMPAYPLDKKQMDSLILFIQSLK